MRIEFLTSNCSECEDFTLHSIVGQSFEDDDNVIVQCEECGQDDEAVAPASIKMEMSSHG